MSTRDQVKLNNLRHSCAHLLAAAVLDLWPGTENAIGPSIEDGFYQDFDFKDVKISENDLPKIEEKMRDLLKTWGSFETREVSVEQAKKDFAWNKYKLELAEEFAKEGKKITENNPGKFLDLCKGGHSENPKEELRYFKLLSIAGAYWRGSKKNKMLTRIYGTCFQSQEELDKYLWQLEEAKKRDHKKVGQELDLFSFHEEGPGFVFWHPNGMRMRQPLIDFWQEKHIKAGYEEVSTPILLTDNLWKQSGHYQNYKDKMYFTKADKQTFALKPMNCPGMILIYKNRQHSYRDLPIKWRELGLVHRHEPSGTLNGLLRERAFRQDDSHIFCREDQIENEIKEVIKLALSIYEVFKFKDIQIELSTRPEKSIGSDKIWNKAETILKKVLQDLKLVHKINEGDGAFYGPKIDFHLTDSLGRLWQCGTIQLDFAMPERFDLTYTDEKGQKMCPIMIHRAIFGSVHRFLAILIEHYGGAFPVWLSPVQVTIVPISDRNNEYGQKVLEQLRAANIRVEIDSRAETMQAKIRDASQQKIPYVLVVGDREEKDERVAVRQRGGKDLGILEVNEFINHINQEIESKAIS